MLHSLFPRAYRRFLSLPLLGLVADGFDDWLAANGYTRVSRTKSIRMLPHVDAELRRRQVKEVANLTQPAPSSPPRGNCRGSMTLVTASP
jgi:hypothetical protein